MKKRIVVAKYDEDISWVKRAIEYGFEVVIYDKGNNDIINLNEFSFTGCEVIQLPNVGKESHTYLTHIIKNYENLYDIEVFLQGRIKDHIISEDFFWNQIKNLNKDTKYLDFSNTKKYQCVNTKTYNYVKSNFVNSKHISIMEKYEDNKKNGHDFLGDIDFFELAFGNLPNDEILFFEISANALFAVSKDRIIQHPKNLYQKYLDLHNPNLFSTQQVYSSPYKMEHFWKILFTYL